MTGAEAPGGSASRARAPESLWDIWYSTFSENSFKARGEDVNVAQWVKARVERRGHVISVTGRLTDEFLIENGRLWVRLEGIASGAGDGGGGDDGAMARSLWVEAAGLDTRIPLVLRSEIWQIPGGQERDATLRSLTVVLSELLARYAHRIDLARGAPGVVELLFYNEIPLEEGVSYLTAFAPVRLRCAPRRVPWRPPDLVTATRFPAPREKYHSHLSHLPLWLDASALWSVHLYDAGALLHAVQFSLDQRFQRSLVSRFRLVQPSST